MNVFVHKIKKKEKYFIPNEEDIRVNYECEVAYLQEDNWTSVKLRALVECDNILSAIYNYNRRIRVPFLTKEQIENEDWEFTKQINNKLYFRKNAFVLTFEDNYINIDNLEGRDIGYWGKCKDINTFRYLMKLLEI